MADSDIPRPLRWSRILGVILAGFLVIEASAQAFFVIWAGKPFNSVFLYRWSPYGLVRNNPNLTGNFEISPNGFRDTRSYTQAKPPNTLRLILLGGSVLYSGVTPVNALPGIVPSDKTISQYLAKRLKQDPAFAGVNIEVINAGVNYNTIRETSASYLADYIHWDPDMVVVFGSANNFATAQRQGQMQSKQLILQKPHTWQGEFDRLVNERSLSSTIEVLFRQAADASAAMAIFHKGLTRNLVENDPGHFLPNYHSSRVTADNLILAPEREEKQYFELYTSFAMAIVGAARQVDQDVAFFWEYHLGDLEGIKPISPEERTIFPAVKRDAIQIAYAKRMHDRWRAFMASQAVIGVDPLEDLKGTSQTVYTDYLHYTANGNALMAKAVHAQLRERLLAVLRRRGMSGPATP